MRGRENRAASQDACTLRSSEGLALVERDRGRRAVGRIRRELVVSIGLQRAAVGRRATPVILVEMTELPTRRWWSGHRCAGRTLLAAVSGPVDHHIGGSLTGRGEYLDDEKPCFRPRCCRRPEVDGARAGGAVDPDARDLFSTWTWLSTALALAAPVGWTTPPPVIPVPLSAM